MVTASRLIADQQREDFQEKESHFLRAFLWSLALEETPEYSRQGPVSFSCSSHSLTLYSSYLSYKCNTVFLASGSWHRLFPLPGKLPSSSSFLGQSFFKFPLKCPCLTSYLPQLRPEWLLYPPHF